MRKDASIKLQVDNLFRNFLPQDDAQVPKALEQIRGLTRRRASAIINHLNLEKPIPAELLDERPAIYDLCRSYLAQRGIRNRISYHLKMFKVDPDTKKANWYSNCGVGGIFPKNLMSIVLGRKQEAILKNSPKNAKISR